MPITLSVPVVTEWDKVPGGALIQAAFSEKPAFGIKTSGDRDGMVVLVGDGWENPPIWSPSDLFDGPPLVLPGSYAVEVIPGAAGFVERSRIGVAGTLRVSADGLAAIVTHPGSYESSKSYDFSSGQANVGKGSSVLFSRWRLVRVPDNSGDERQVVFERGPVAPKTVEE